MGVWGGRSWSRTLQPADVRPLLLLHHGALQLGTEGHVIHVVQQDADHLTGEVLQPGDRDHLAELQRWRETPASASVSPWKRPISQRQIFLPSSGCITAKILGMILIQTLSSATFILSDLTCWLLSAPLLRCL